MRLLLITLVLVFSMMACDDLLLGDQEAVVSLEENLQSPPTLNDGWEVSDLSSQGIDASRILPWLERLHEDPKNIHSVLIIRNNKLVAEAYFGGWHRDRLHTLRSASKSFVSTLTGIAVDQGYVAVDDKVFDFFPDYAKLNDDERKADIEIRHLLTMTSGLLWDEKTYSYPDKRNDEYALDTSKDRLGYLLGKPMDAIPGTKFVYNSGGPFLQSAILERATGEDIETFSGKHFFEPLEIKNYFWRQEGDDLIPATGPLFLCSRDMAKLGQLFLGKGKWKGKQIISSEWVDDATATFIGNEDDGEGYGYNWWIARSFIDEEEVRVYMARGNGGQFIFVAPQFNAVVVFTGGNFDDPPGAPSPYRLLTSGILPAMQ